jgi:hypothetical protein
MVMMWYPYFPSLFFYFLVIPRAAYSELKMSSAYNSKPSYFVVILSLNTELSCYEKLLIPFYDHALFLVMFKTYIS